MIKLNSEKGVVWNFARGSVSISVWDSVSNSGWGFGLEDIYNKLNTNTFKIAIKNFLQDD